MGTEHLKKVLTNLSTKFEIVGVSSVYKVDRRAESFAGLRDIKKAERLEALTMVLRAKTSLGAHETLAALVETERALQHELLKRTVSLNLMIYNSEIIMLPELAVPHPEMHLRPEEIVPAVELWPEYVHPVLNQTLAELSQQFSHERWGEFFTQGQPLLDF